MIAVGKTYPLRGGLTARIGFTDKKGVRPISGLVDVGERENHHTWYSNGRAWDGMESNYDIIMPEPERKSRWLNWYGTSSGGSEFETRKEADYHRGTDGTHVFEIITKNGEPVDVKIHKVER